MANPLLYKFEDEGACGEYVNGICTMCGAGVEEHAGIEFRDSFTEAELQDPNHRFHDQYMRLKARNG